MKNRLLFVSHCFVIQLTYIVCFNIIIVDYCCAMSQSDIRHRRAQQEFLNSNTSDTIKSTISSTDIQTPSSSSSKGLYCLVSVILTIISIFVLIPAIFYIFPSVLYRIIYINFCKYFYLIV